MELNKSTPYFTLKHIAMFLLALLTLACLPVESSHPVEIQEIVSEWEQITGDAADKDDAKTIVEAWRILSEQFVDKEEIDLDSMKSFALEAMINLSNDGKTDVEHSENLRHAAITGMLNSLNDPYSTYLRPSRYNMFVGDIKGSFEGIGATVGSKNGDITILKPHANTPAESAGLIAGDIIKAVNGESTHGWSILDTVLKIRGPKGTAVELSILRASTKQIQVIRIVRDVIDIKSLESKLLDGDVLYLKLISFSENTDEDLSKVLKDFIPVNPVGIILDLRGNSGGLLSSTINIASHFIEKGMVFYILDSDQIKTDYNVNEEVPRTRTYFSTPLLVLTDESSASASEVLAGALQDHERAIILGSSTFGKGSANLNVGLSDGSGIYFTIARWYTPEGNIIEGSGLTPDVFVRDEIEDNVDDVLDTAKQYLLDNIYK